MLSSGNGLKIHPYSQREKNRVKNLTESRIVQNVARCVNINILELSLKVTLY